MVLSLIVSAIVLLIAYWWCNQGFFSALLHFLCVLVAGAVAFSLWEWATVTFFLSGKRYDEYAWGVTLVGIFVVVLFVLRLLTDKLAPNEVRLPGPINYGLGAVFGLAAGILSTGVVLMGWGFVQASSDIFGYEGFRRSQSNNGLPEQTQPNHPPTLILKATEYVYGRLSEGAFHPVAGKITFAKAMPRISELAGSAQRDSFNDGKGKTSAPPGSITVPEFFELPTSGPGQYVARIDVKNEAFDRFTTFTLSASQARLVGEGKEDDIPSAAYPTDFGQKNAATDRMFLPYAFSDMTYYASSPSGSQDATVYLFFPKAQTKGQKPAFLQVKGLRLALPAVQVEPTISSPAMFLALKTGAAGSEGKAEIKTLLADASTQNPNALTNAHIEANKTIAPASGTVNETHGSLEYDESHYIVSGAGDFRRSGPSFPNRDLVIKGIFEPQGTRIVRLNVSKGSSPVDIFNIDKIRALRKVTGEDASVEIVDTDFDTYQPFGYIWERSSEATVWVYVDYPPGGRWTLKDLPMAGDNDKLWLLYRLPQNKTVSAVIFRDPMKETSKAKVSAVSNWTVPPK